MATYYSDQEARTQSQGYSLNDAGKSNGRQHTAVGTMVSTAVVAGSVLQMLRLPKRARVLGGRLISGALGTSVTLSVGSDKALVAEDGSTALTAAGVANLLAATPHASATVTPVAATRALGAGGLTTGETIVNVVTGGATLTAGIDIQLQIDYIVD